MTSEVATIEDRDQKRKVALLRAIGLDKVPPEQREIALEIAKRYELDLLLKHLVLVDGRPYITRDGLLHVGHRSGVLDGIEVSDPVLVDMPGAGQFWTARCSVYRKDMSRPFTYQGRYPSKGGNQRFAPEMAVKVAEVMALRRAFDVSAPVIEERWDMDTQAPEPAPPLREAVAAKRQAITSGRPAGADASVGPDAGVAAPQRAGAASQEPPHPADTAGPVTERAQAGAGPDTPEGISPGNAERAETVDDRGSEPAPASGPGAVSPPSGPDAMPARCEGFHIEHGACRREPGHAGNHQNADKESWR